MYTYSYFSSAYDRGTMDELLELYALHLGRYLRTQRLDVMRVYVHGLGIRLYFPKACNVEIRLFTVDEVEPLPYLCLIGNWVQVYSVEELPRLIMSRSAETDCSGCHYTDTNSLFCGQGVEMYTGTCTKYKEVQG